MKSNQPVINQEYLEYLDDLRESGVTNMYGAASYLRSEFNELNKEDAAKILIHWMETFSERHASVKKS